MSAFLCLWRIWTGAYPEPIGICLKPRVARLWGDEGITLGGLAASYLTFLPVPKRKNRVHGHTASTAANLVLGAAAVATRGGYFTPHGRPGREMGGRWSLARAPDADV
ncbi:hypothetical protein RRG08_028662 [Elysia crispata]|uniref:Uncharacterized protein n=1 Tax=Elysia crispata TaxID=231223 RepID=A0AAE1DDB9_9GAST|nr:hypothetical protein RRG08_028662 [Elysia crispata]